MNNIVHKWKNINLPMFSVCAKYIYLDASMLLNFRHIAKQLKLKRIVFKTAYKNIKCALCNELIKVIKYCTNLYSSNTAVSTNEQYTDM